ncbi:MAG: heme lyase CcmF/NrfE family subunit [Proteobacteria bacterium]|nr:heme lyase CcmF/NrfE family subunit [Pseudomonadota bacterium]
MADLGAISLWIALALSSYACIGSVVGKLRGVPALVESSRKAVYLLVLVMLVATLSLVTAFINRDFEIAYVAGHSNLAMPYGFTWVAFYAGNEGSLLYIAFVLSVMSALAIWLAPARVRPSLPYTAATLMLVQTFFLVVMAVMANPFEKLAVIPLDGQGINPLLTHFGMFFHPPALMAGLIGITVPFAFAIGALLAGKTGDEWVDAGRTWGIISWVLLASGLLLGSWWAYTILGWGGFWFWDPVENAAFMPWLAGTALLHSAVVVEKRDTLKGWTIFLAIVTFALSLLGTFLVRSGVLTSVHAFATDPARGAFILVLLLVVIGGSLALFAWRGPSLASTGLFQPISREGSLLLNNLLLTTAAAAVLLGTLYPLFLDAVGGGKVSVGPPFFNAVFLPLMAPMVATMAVGPLLTWKRGELGPALTRLWVAFAALAAAAVLAWAVVADGPLFALLGMGLAAWLFVGTVVGFAERVKLFRVPLPETLRRIGRVPRNAWGMTLAHGGLAIAIAGMTGAGAWKVETIQAMKPGDTATVAGFTFTFEGARQVPGPNYSATRGTFTVARDGRPVVTLRPEKRDYPVERSLTTEAAIHPTIFGDLYAVIGDAQGSEGAFVTRLYFNPLVGWMWGGILVMVAGGMVSLSDRRHRVGAPKTSRAAAGARAGAPARA